MDKIDPRLLVVGVEIDGVLKVYQDIAISVSADKSATPKDDECTIEMLNLDKRTRDYLLTETSPFNANRTQKRVIVQAGRESYGLSTVFVGDVTESKASQPPDIGVELKCSPGASFRGVLVSRSYPGKQSLRGIAANVAQDLGATLVFQAADKLVQSEAYSGSALRQVGRLGDAGGVSAYLDGETLVVKTTGSPLDDRLRVLNVDSGMVGLPETTDKGIKARMLFDPGTVLGGALEIQSAINPSLNGVYTIFKLQYDLTNRDNPFYQTAEATRNG